jgi:ABC-type cobalt transport system, permease component CbiQ and related transporters
MIRDITIGQYYPSNSILHKLDPRVKFIGSMLFVVSLFVLDTWIGYLIATIFLGTIITLSKVPLWFMLKGLKPIIFLMLFTMIFNLLFTPGEALWQWGVVKITREGLIVTGKMMIRLIYLILGSSLMTLTTTPTQLTSALERILRPLNKIKVPVHEIAMMMSIALRFIPILLEETDKIMKAQTARGADFESGGLIKRVKSMIPLLVPLFVSAFRRADDLAMAMEARCYHGGKGRTQMKPLVYKRRDLAAYLVLAIYLGMCILLTFVWRTL